MDEAKSLSHSRWECKDHVVFIPTCRSSQHADAEHCTSNCGGILERFSTSLLDGDGAIFDEAQRVPDLLSYPRTFETCARLCAGRAGQLPNLASLANGTGVSPTTVRAWIGLSEASLILFRLIPYHANISKRLFGMKN